MLAAGETVAERKASRRQSRKWAAQGNSAAEKPAAAAVKDHVAGETRNSTQRQTRNLDQSRRVDQRGAEDTSERAQGRMKTPMDVEWAYLTAPRWKSPSRKEISASNRRLKAAARFSLDLPPFYGLFSSRPTEGVVADVLGDVSFDFDVQQAIEVLIHLAFGISVQMAFEVFDQLENQQALNAVRTV